MADATALSVIDLDPDDRKLIVLARSARARTGTAQGAALRDTDGRTYAAATVSLQTLHISAVSLAVAMAVTSGVKGLEAVVLLSDAGFTPEEVSVLAEVGGAAMSVFFANLDGSLREHRALGEV